MAIDNKLDIYDLKQTSRDYNGCLLDLAEDLGLRLSQAFHTKTGIPYGTVNLRYGVPKGESEVASAAGAGSLLLEFEVLSTLTRNATFGRLAFNALNNLYNYRSNIGLLGKHIHIKKGDLY
jgi:mannosidase alpha-like ER degradation enhancer 2